MKVEIFEADENNDGFNIQGWDKVRRFLDEGDLAGLVVSLIEAEKLLNQTLKEKKYPGRNFTERIKSAKDKFSNFSGLLQARKIKRQVCNELKYNLTSMDIEYGINQFKQAIFDLTSEEKSGPSLLNRIMLINEYYLPSKLNFLKKFLVYLVIAFFAILFLANTQIGLEIVRNVVLFVNTIFNWVLIVVLVAVGIIITIIITLLYFERRRRINY